MRRYRTGVDDDQAARISDFTAVDAGLVEAPAGYGKTHLLLDIIEANTGKPLLILTHTVAGVAVIRDRILRRGVLRAQANVSTIAGWQQQFVNAYSPLVGVGADELKRLEATDNKRYWKKVNETFEALLRTDVLRVVILASYGAVYVDEYQDCNVGQHRIFTRLKAILPVRVLGDDMQAIFGFDGDKVDWSDVVATFPLVTTLSAPQRWIKSGNIEYANWIAAVRTELVAGRPVNLGAGNLPTCVKVISIPADYDDYMGAILAETRLALPDGHKRLIIGDKANTQSKALVKRLSWPRYQLIESLYSKDIEKLKKLGATLDFTGADDELAIFKVVEDCLSGIPQSIKAGVDKFRRHEPYNPRLDLLVAIGDLQNAFTATKALILLNRFEALSGVSCSRRQPLLILEMALTAVGDGRSATYEGAVNEAVASLNRRGRHLPRYSIGSTLLVKGLEVEEVVILDIQKLNRNDLYVALTRPTRKLTIFTNATMLTARP